MKFIILLLFTLSFHFSSRAQTIKSLLYLHENMIYFKGKPKHIKETYTSYYQSGETSVQKTITSFDQHALPSSKTFLRDDGSISSIVNYRFDTVKRVLLESNIVEKNPKSPTNKIKTVYFYENEKGLVKLHELNKYGAVLSELLIKNNSQGLPIELKLYEPKEYFFGSEKAEYLLDKNKVIVSVFNNDGTLVNKDTANINFRDAQKYPEPNFKYDVNGNIISAQSTLRNGVINYKEFEYQYDENGNWIKQKVFNLKYDPKGKKTMDLKTQIEKKITYWK